MARELEEYERRRDFNKTGEPSPGSRSSDKDRTFVIQKHDARNLHYDFRLSIDGVLKSWAVPKGPSTDTRVKRLAILTEDHPMEYADFEGVIPEGEYGAGTVMVWDRGGYRNLRSGKEGKRGKGAASMEASYRDGHIEVWLEGHKLRGGYALTRTGSSGKREKWLLVKMRDEEADARRNPTSTETESVVSGRTMKEIEEEHSGG